MNRAKKIEGGEEAGKERQEGEGGGERTRAMLVEAIINYRAGDSALFVRN